METAMLLVGLAIGAFVLVCGVVGVRLLAIARRTHQSPELCLGIGLLCLVLALPLLAIAGVGRGTVGEGKPGLMALSLFAVWMGFGALFLFTRMTFRPNARWAAALVAVFVVLQGIIQIGSYRALTTAPPEMSSFEAGGIWLAASRLPMIASFAWTFLEGLNAWRMAKRRLAIGLGDAVVAHRFLLWSLAGLFPLVDHLIGLVLHSMGLVATSDPLAAACTATLWSVSAGLMWLAFLPPAAYVRWVQREAPAAS